MRKRTHSPTPDRGAFRVAALAVALATVLLLVHFPPCGPNGEACAAMIGMDSEGAPSNHPAAGASCPLTGAGEAGMDCCESSERGQAPPATPESTDKQLRNQIQAPTPTVACAECVPCMADPASEVDETPGAALPDVPIYTLLSSYLS